MRNQKATIAYWEQQATQKCGGKIVDRIEYWQLDYNHAPVIIFGDGTYLIAMSDDEGNDAGALHTSDDNFPIIPTI